MKLVKRELYALVDPSTVNIYASKFQIGCVLASDAYFSYHEALEYYGLANQSFIYISKTLVYSSKSFMKFRKSIPIVFTIYLMILMAFIFYF